MKVRLSPLQIALLLMLVPLVAGSYYYPHLIYRMGTRGWWLTIVGGDGATYGLVWLWLALISGFSPGTFMGAMIGRWGRMAGTLFLVPLVGPLWLSAVIMVRELAVLTTESLLPHTAISAIFLVGLMTAWYIAYLGVKGVSRYVEVVTILIGLPLILGLYAIAFENSKFVYLAPWWWMPDHLDLMGVLELPLSFSGVLALPMLLPYVDVMRQLKSGVAWAFLVGTLALLVVVAGPLGTLGPATAEITPLPALTFFNAAATAILFIQQLAYPMVAVWVVLFVGAAAFAFWGSARAVSEIFGWSRTRGYILAISMALAWMINQALPTVAQFRQIIVVDGVLTTFGLIWMVLTSIPMYFLAKHRHDGRTPHASPS